MLLNTSDFSHNCKRHKLLLKYPFIKFHPSPFSLLTKLAERDQRSYQMPLIEGPWDEERNTIFPTRFYRDRDNSHCTNSPLSNVNAAAAILIMISTVVPYWYLP